MQDRWFVIIALALVGCSSLLDLESPAFEKKIVLTGILHPDSTLKIKLSFNQPNDDTLSPTLIDNASVSFQENGIDIGIGKPIGQGRYELQYKPKPSYTYKVRANINGFPVLAAEDIVPDVPIFSTQVSLPNPSNPNENPDIFITISQKDTYWISAYRREFNKNSNTTTTKSQSILSNSIEFDFFNSSFDNLLGMRSFEYYARIDQLKVALLPYTIKLITVNSINQLKSPQEGFYLLVFRPSSTYDNYLKSSIIAYQNRLLNSDGELNNPFAESTPVFGNVTNGLGLFGAINSKVVVIK